MSVLNLKLQAFQAVCKFAAPVYSHIAYIKQQMWHRVRRPRKCISRFGKRGVCVCI